MISNASKAVKSSRKMTERDAHSNCCTPGCCDGGDRRTFLKLAGMASIAALAPGPLPGAQPDPAFRHYIPGEKKLNRRWVNALFSKGPRKPYRGRELGTIGMPCGGVGADQIYVRGDGTLAHFWIANNAYNTGQGNYFPVSTPVGTYPHMYDTFRPFSPIQQGFAIRVKPARGKAQVRLLSREGFDDIRFFGEYPIATIEYGVKEKLALSVTLRAEVFSPFIPLNARDSAIPVTVLRYTVMNTSKEPVDVSLAGWLQNPVMLELWGNVPAKSRNTLVRNPKLTSIHLTAVEASKDVLPERRIQIFEDFERGDFKNWKVEGEAFGEGPVTGALPGQQPATGWKGKYFVSSRHGGDASQGRMISRPFQIKEPYIAFLIGGGRLAGSGLQLVVDGKVVRAATSGVKRERLNPKYWDVTTFIGKHAHIEIFDRLTAEWGHTNVDHIYFTNLPPLPEEKFSTDHVQFGDMALSVMDPKATASAAWTSKEAFLADLAENGRLNGPAEEVYPLGEKRCGALASSFRLEPGKARQVTFLLTWHFPNRRRDTGVDKGESIAPRVGNMYSNWFKDSLQVASYVAADLGRLARDTFLFRDTYFDTTLPYWFVQRIAMPMANLATQTCQWWANGRFWAWEGVGCCFGTCNHVWNYAQGLARVFPELERSVREMQDLDEAFDPRTGAVGHRGGQTEPVFDGQAGTVLKVYREHLMSPDDRFLKQYWPKVKSAIEWLIGQDVDSDGLIEGIQANTYDISLVGANTFVGGLYLAALRAGEEMARRLGDSDFARRLKAIFESGRALTVERLWNGEYFIQDVDLKKHPKSQYADGCLADQLFGQSWAHQVDLGYIYPQEHVRSALKSIWKYNWAPDVGPQNRSHPPERIFARPAEAGLFICTWPRSVHLGENGVRYRDEVWTGIEYQVAAHMFYEGMGTEALAMVRAIHERYDGAKHNPWNEVECGDHYARALASWGCLLGVSGFLYDGPDAKIGFAPRLAPENFKGFFTAAESWGSLAQTRQGSTQINRIEVKWGKLRIKTLVFQAPAGMQLAENIASVGGRQVPSRTNQEGTRITVSLDGPASLESGESIETRHVWRP